METWGPTMPDIAFTALTIIAIATAILALESKEIVYGAISLALMLLSMAGFFILLEAPFVAMFQVIVYVGAVAVLILFTVMLVRREKWIRTDVVGMRLVGIIAGLTLSLSFGLLLLQSTLGTVVATGDTVSFMEIGVELITEYWVALIVLALLLAASLIGALMLARLEKEE
jgi:NADH:ubiquinone oxidoreductase subunit 6 (subunit J)